jgi:hypothetical protein
MFAYSYLFHVFFLLSTTGSTTIVWTWLDWSEQQLFPNLRFYAVLFFEGVCRTSGKILPPLPRQKSSQAKPRLFVSLRWLHIGFLAYSQLFQDWQIWEILATWLRRASVCFIFLRSKLGIYRRE